MQARLWATRLAVALAPVAIVLITPGLAGWEPVLPRAFVPTEGAFDASGGVLTALTGQLASLALATIVAALVLLREPDLPRGGFGTATVVIIAAASSLYAGYRFQIGLAEQLAAGKFDIARLHDRLDWQGFSLLISVSALFVQGVIQLQARKHRMRSGA